MSCKRAARRVTGRAGKASRSPGPMRPRLLRGGIRAARGQPLSKSSPTRTRQRLQASRKSAPRKYVRQMPARNGFAGFAGGRHDRSHSRSRSRSRSRSHNRSHSRSRSRSHSRSRSSEDNLPDWGYSRETGKFHMPWHKSVKKIKHKLYDAVPGLSAVGAGIHGAANVVTAASAAMLGAYYMGKT